MLLTCCWGSSQRREPLISNGHHVSRYPEREKASYSELVLFGPSEILLRASPCPANPGKGIDVSQRGAFRVVNFSSLMWEMHLRKNVLLVQSEPVRSARPCSHRTVAELCQLGMLLQCGFPFSNTSWDAAAS